MKIGIDMDDTICNTKESLTKYSNKFMKDNNILYNDSLWNNNINKEIFLNTYLKDIYNDASLKENAKEVLVKLKNMGHELYIITARTNTYINNQVINISNYLKKNNIEVDGIIIDAKDKVDACINNNIDIMVDDNLYNYNKLISNNIKTILFDDNNKYQEINLKINNWNDLFKYLN